MTVDMKEPPENMAGHDPSVKSENFRLCTHRVCEAGEKLAFISVRHCSYFHVI